MWNTFDLRSNREFPEPSKKLFKMGKISNEDLGMSADTKVSNPHESCPYVEGGTGLSKSPEPKSRSESPDKSPPSPKQTPPHVKMEKISNEDVGMSVDTKVLNPHESCPYVREENKTLTGFKESPEVKSRDDSPNKSPARPRQTPPHVILNEIDQSRWIDLGGGWRFQVKSNLKQIRNTKMIFAMFDHESFGNKNVSEEIPHARHGTFHVSYYLRNLNSDNEETDIHATYAFKNSKTKNNEKRHYGPRFNEATQKKAFKHTGKPYCLRELLELFNETRPDKTDIFMDYINDLKLSVTRVPVKHDSWPMRRKSQRSGRRSSRR